MIKQLTGAFTILQLLLDKSWGFSKLLSLWDQAKL
jgi:hypothetical protein